MMDGGWPSGAPYRRGDYRKRQNRIRRLGVDPRCSRSIGEDSTMKTDARPIHLAGSQLGDVRHVCAFFNSNDEEYRVLLSVH